jgi:predicted nucleic acid-binding protein
VRVYCDSSALIKRALAEPESLGAIAAMTGFADAGDTLLTSSLALVEVSRAIRSRQENEDPALWVELTATALSGVFEAPIDDPTVALARRIGPGVLRSLDAIHLATAVLADADLLLTYDTRLISIARDMGIDTASPG